VTRRYMGERVLRREDARFLTGRGQYLDNISVPRALHMVVVRSPFAHAGIGAVDVAAALEAPGVVAVFTGEELRPRWGAPLPMMWPVTDDILIPEHWPLAVGEAKFAGDGVAVVLARSFVQAKDAAELVDVEYDPLPSVTDMDEALGDGAPLVHADFGTNRCYHLAYANGDPDMAFAEADVVVSRRIRIPRVLPTARGQCSGMRTSSVTGHIMGKGAPHRGRSSSPVNTATTPEASRAAATSTTPIRAWANGDRTTTMCRAPGTEMLSRY